MPSKPIYVAIILFLISAVGFQVVAQETQGIPAPSFTIAPSIIELETQKGNKYGEVIFIKNDNKLVVPIQTEVITYVGDDLYNFETLGFVDASTWVGLEPSEFILDEKEEEEIKITITIPETAEPGSYILNILFKPVLPPDYFLPQSTHYIGYIAAVMAINVDLEDKSVRDPYKVEVDRFTTKSVTTQSEITFEATYSNQDKFYHKVSGDLMIRDVFGNEVAEIPLGDKNLLPGNVKGELYSWGKELLLGPYNAELEVQVGENVINKQIGFWVFPIQQILILLVILIVILIVLWKRGKRIWLAVRTFVGRAPKRVRRWKGGVL